MTYRNPKLLEGARDQPCVLCGSHGTTVAAHSNSLQHGRGHGHKAPDYMVAYVCFRHHELIDGRMGGLEREVKRAMWLEAWIKTVPLFFELELVK